MKRLLFSVAGLSAIFMMNGCSTPTGAFKSADGKALMVPGGGAIVVTDKEVVPPTKTEVSPTATYLERLSAKKADAEREIQISVAAAEQAKELYESMRESVLARIKTVRGQGVDGLKTILEFVNGRPKVKADVLNQLARTKNLKLEAGCVVALQALLLEDVQTYLVTSVYPQLAKDIVSALGPKVEKALNEGKYAFARELIWNASTYNIPELDECIRNGAVEILHGKVNPQNWEVLEKKIKAAFQKAMESKAYEQGVTELKKIRDESLVREYSKYVDKKIASVKEELIKLNVPEKDLKPILDKQSAIIAAAAKITDVCDKYISIADAKKEIREDEARKDPALQEYYRRLDDFHTSLLWYNCTKENADRIAADLDRDVLALIQLIRKGGKAEVGANGALTALQLGTRSLNDRIRATVADYCKRLRKSDLEKKVRDSVAQSKFEEARELIWNAAATGDADIDASMFTLGLSLLRTEVNPADWTRIEKEIRGTFARLSAEGKFVELTAFLRNYPLIRQHSITLDKQLAKVRAEAEALGADPTAAAKAAQTACGMVTEAEQLVDHLDKLEADAAKGGKPIDKTKFMKELEVYAKKLAAYHATDANVKAIVGKLQAELEKLFVVPTNPKTTHLALGTNAVNDRIRALTQQLLALIEKAKYDWETAELTRKSSDLEKRVRKAVKEQRFDDARAYIRDEKLIGRQDVDLKLYELRVGLLDSCVNPAQLDYLLAEIDAKVKKFQKAKDFAGLLDYIANPPQVHDEYEKIDHALAAVKNAMLALEISAAEAEKDEKIRFFASIQELLEKRRESWKPERDLNAVEKALTEVAKAMFAHLNKHPELIAGEKKAEYQHILADIAALDRTITTWEMNELLRARLQKEYKVARHERDLQLYAELLAKIDGDVSFDTQIMLAEEAISRQLGVNCEKASFKINAVLGEYARAFRLLKQGGELSTAEATSVLLGGAYLDQAGVVGYAIKLGAQIDGVSARDPRKRTALMLAIDTQHLTLIQAILKAGASSTAADADGNTVMHYAVKSGSVAVVTAIAKTAPMAVVNAAGETPLFAAVRRNQAALVKAVTDLVKKDERAAFVNTADKSGLTAFALAAKTGARDVLDALAAAGAKYSEKDLILAEKGDHVAVAQWLVGKGADVNAPGVMEAACPATATGRYLVHEGGVGKHACKVCQPPKPVKVPPAAPAKKCAQAEGNITFKMKECK